MSVTLKASWASEASISITGLDSLADTSAASSDAVDNTTNLYISALVEIELTGSSASNTDDCTVALQRGIDGTNYETGPAGNQNMELVGILKMNGANLVRSIFFIENLGPYFKIRIYNDSGDALESSGNAIKYRGLHYTAA